MSYALAEYREGIGYEVWCSGCNNSIGTMSGDMLQRAIGFYRRVFGRGVTCPECNKVICAACGNIHRTERDLETCKTLSVWFLMSEEKEGTTACLVGHNFSEDKIERGRCYE